MQFLNPDNYERCKAFIETGDSHIIRSEIKPYSTRRVENSLDRLGYVILQANDYLTVEEILKKIK